MSDGRNRWRGIVSATLTVAAAVASLVAILFVIALLWWVRSLSTGPVQEPVPAVRATTQHLRAEAPVEARAALAPARPTVQQVAVAVTPLPTPGPTTALPTHGPNDDAAKNRALGAALSKLADDPELQRQLHTGPSEAAR